MEYIQMFHIKTTESMKADIKRYMEQKDGKIKIRVATSTTNIGCKLPRRKQCHPLWSSKGHGHTHAFIPSKFDKEICNGVDLKKSTTVKSLLCSQAYFHRCPL